MIAKDAPIWRSSSPALAVPSRWSSPKALIPTAVGRTVVIRYSGLARRLPVALSVSPGLRVRHAVVRGTIVHLASAGPSSRLVKASSA